MDAKANGFRDSLHRFSVILCCRRCCCVEMFETPFRNVLLQCTIKLIDISQPRSYMEVSNFVYREVFGLYVLVKGVNYLVLNYIKCQRIPAKR